MTSFGNVDCSIQPLISECHLSSFYLIEFLEHLFSGVPGFETPQLALDSLYQALIKAYLRAEEKKAFKREQACEELRKFGKALDE